MAGIRLGRRRLLRWGANIAALLLLAIGIRFMLWPQAAAGFFGIGPARAGASFDLHRVVGLRDIWLAVILLGLVRLELWQGVALWFGAAALVCLGDAVIAWSSSGSPASVLFHTASAVGCTVLALTSRREAGRAGRGQVPEH